MRPRQGIYEIANTITGERYVGSSRDTRQRWATHLKALSAGASHCKRLQRAWNEYGAAAFEFAMLERVADEGSLLRREQAHLDSTPVPLRYNSTSRISSRIRRDKPRLTTGFGFGERVVRPTLPRAGATRRGTVVDRYGKGIELYGVLWDDASGVEYGVLRTGLVQEGSA